MDESLKATFERLLSLPPDTMLELGEMLTQESRKRHMEELKRLYVEGYAVASRITGAEGYDPFSHKRQTIQARTLVYYYLYTLGNTAHEIANAVGYDRTTIIHGIQVVQSQLRIGYSDMTAYWQEFKSQIGTNKRANDDEGI